VLLTTRRRFSEGTDDEDGAAEEIDAGGCGRGAPAAGRFGAEGEAPGTRAGGTCDNRRRKELEGVFTGDEELWAASNGAVAGSSRRWHARVGARREGAGARVSAKGQHRCLALAFIKWRG
jgi:hypothetical protein